MITHVDDQDDDDGLGELLRPGPVLLAPPDGAYDRIRRDAARRRRLRALVGGGLTLAVAAAIAWPVYLTAMPAPPAPAVPAAPPALSTDPPAPRLPSPSASPSSSADPRRGRPAVPTSGTGRAAPHPLRSVPGARRASTTPTPSAARTALP